GLALDKKNYQLIEALEEKYAAGLVTLDEYEIDLARLLKASTTTTGFVTYKAKWGPKYHGDTEDGLLALYSKLLDGFETIVGPVDELSGMVTVPRTFRPITCNGMMWVWQRWDVDKGRDNDKQDGAYFSQFSNRFANDDDREMIENMLIEISETHEPSILLHVGWNPSKDAIPPVLERFHNFDDETALDAWIDVHFGHLAKDGSGRSSSYGEQMAEVGVDTLVFGGSELLLSFDKMDITRGILPNGLFRPNTGRILTNSARMHESAEFWRIMH
ncbi:hypothetical protein HDU80_003417, partial [Chytriomyces hyalinus]